MSVVSVEEVAKGARESVQKIGSRTDSRVFHVICDDPCDGPWVARSAAGVPGIYEAHPKDITIWCTEIRAKPYEEDPLHFRVVARYGIRREAEGGGGDPEHPETWPAEIDDASEHVQEEITEDVDGVPIANSLGDLFRGVMCDVTYSGMVFTQYEVSYSGAVALFYSDRVNISPWEGMAANQGKLSKIRGRWDSAKGLWSVSYTIKLHWFGWNPRLIDRGRRHKLPGVYNPTWRDKVAILDANGFPVSQDVNLDGDGNVLADGAPLVYLPDNNDPDKRFKKYRELDFALIGIRHPQA